ncbi:Flavin-dependent thymidylate synthase [compost metagenome]
MRAEYISHMGSDLTVVNSARVSFAKESALDGDSLVDQDVRLISYLARHNHFTPFTHPQITLRETVPIFVARQRFKHMVGFTYNEVSRRYVDDAPEFFHPDVWRSRPDGSVKQGSGGAHPHTRGWSAMYDHLIAHAEDLYDHMVSEGVAPEQARMLLPQSMLTSYYVTGSLAAFARAYRQRIDSHAQEEIRVLARQWDEVIAPLYPVSWAALVEQKEITP